MKNKRLTGDALLILLLAAGSLFFYRNTINEFPSYLHAWTQSDRYALSLGFLNNGFDFFHPETYNLNPQFPPAKPLSDPQGITAVDFPVHEYTVSLLMWLFNTREPWVFRGYTLLFSLVGLFILYRFSTRITGSYFAAWIIVFFIFLSPVFTYYQAGFLPTIPALAAFFAGMGLYMHTGIQKNFRKEVMVIACFTFAALVRTPFVIPLLAALGADFLTDLKRRSFRTKLFIAYFISIALILSYFLYNNHLRNEYGSIALSRPLPPSSLGEIREIAGFVLSGWGRHYLTVYHLAVFLLLTAVSLFLVFRNGKSFRPDMRLTVFAVLVAAGTLFYSVMMARQLKHHDYYFLDTFFSLIVIFLLFTLQFLSSRLKYASAGFLVLLLLFIPPAIRSDNRIQKERRVAHSWDKITLSVDYFSGSAGFLDDLGIERKDVILVMDAYSPNIPFILMDRKGFTLTATKGEVIERSLQWGFDYVVIPDASLFSDVVAAYPSITGRLERVGGNGLISVFRKGRNSKPVDYIEFAGLENTNPAAEFVFSCDSSGAAPPFARPYLSDSNYVSPPNSLFVGKEVEYFSLLPPEFTVSSKALFPRLFMMCNFRTDRNTPAISLVISSDETGLYYKTPLKKYIREPGEWNKMALLLPLKPVESGKKLKLYFWNPSGEEVFFDNVVVRIY
ncbi:MAG: hypothetical protein JXA03_04895 [Bacteroidales bacterium]|nr:hypothetical protein [Bacteroidales bacterium]